MNPIEQAPVMLDDSDYEMKPEEPTEDQLRQIRREQMFHMSFHDLGAPLTSINIVYGFIKSQFTDANGDLHNAWLNIEAVGKIRNISLQSIHHPDGSGLFEHITGSYNPIRRNIVAIALADIQEQHEVMQDPGLYPSLRWPDEKRNREVRRLRELSEQYPNDVFAVVRHEIGRYLDQFIAGIEGIPGEKKKVMNDYLASLGILSRGSIPVTDVLTSYAQWMRDDILMRCGVALQLDTYIPQPEDISIHSWIKRRHALYDLAGSYGQRPVHLHVEHINDQDAIYIDPKILAIIVDNLVSNALRYSKNSTDPIFIRLLGTDGSIRISVIDHGIGITDDVLRNVRQFTVSYRAEEVGHIKGTGLGLHMSNILAQRSRGFLEVRSPGPKKGSTFTFVLPKNIH